MLADIYIAALLSNPELADYVWDLWNIGLISDETAAMAWLTVASHRLVT